MKRVTEYYEAILQIRVDLPAEIVKGVITNVKKKREFNHWVQGGEYYFSSVKAAKEVSRRLSRQFRLKITESRKQTGYDRSAGKRKYKWSICLKPK